MPLRVYACVRESVFLRGLESVFPSAGAVLCGGSVDEAMMFDSIPQDRPDVLIYDPGIEDNLDYLSLLRRNHPRIPVLVLFEPGCEDWLTAARERGAADCLPKTLTREVLLEALGRVAPEPPDSAEPDRTARAGCTDPLPLNSEGIQRKRLSALLMDLDRYAPVAGA